VCIYELLCGGLPFGDQQQNPIEIYEDIIKAELRFPNFFEQQEAKEVIEQLL
jgi:cGMP-dependent protein kinase